MDQETKHSKSIALALLVTFLWSTSIILIKLFIHDIPALPFAGLRYFIAFLCLLPFLFRKKRINILKQLSLKSWIRLIVLGIVFYTITQGAQFLSLKLLPAVTASLVLSFTPICVALLGIFILKERLSALQWWGIGIYIAGLVLYFLPFHLFSIVFLGIIAALIGMLANSAASILGRYVNRLHEADALTVTIVSMGIGSIILLISGFSIQGIPILSPLHWAIILWLAVINSAIAFTLWNYTLKTLTAMQSSIINNTMLFQIAVLSWLFLNEHLSFIKVTGIVISTAGVVLVQIRRSA